jgi:hypothetical protein
VLIIVVGLSYSTQPVAPPWETANDRIFRRIAKYDEALHAGIAEWRATQPPYSRPHSPPSDTLIREMEELEISPAFFEGPMYPTFPVDWTQKERGQMADAMAVCYGRWRARNWALNNLRLEIHAGTEPYPLGYVRSRSPSP